MFVSGGLFILLAVALILVAGLLIFTRGLGWFGRLPGDIRHEGRRTRVYAPLTSMLLLSLVFSMLMFLLGLIF